MKILYINSVYKIGSTGRIVAELGAYLRERSDDFLACYGRGKQYEEQNIFKIGSNLDNYIQVLFTRVFDKHGANSIISTKRLIKEIISYSPDVIHLHNLHGYYLNIEVLFDFLYRYNKPIIWTLHDCWAITGHCSHFDYIGCDKWQYECSACEQKKRYPASLAFDNSKNNYHLKKELFTKIDNLTITVPSKWLAHTIEKSFLNKCPIKLIYNGVDLNIFKPTKSDIYKKMYGIENRKIIMGAASVWDERKGLEDFIELSKKIDNDYIIVLVGLKPQQIKKLPPNVIGIERTGSLKQLAELYSNADIFVSLSSEETFGLVVVEAMACGTPVIVYNTTASPELIVEGCGKIVSAGDITGVSETIDAMIKLNKEEFRDKCIRHVQMWFDKEHIYKEYYNLYKDVK